MKKILSINLLLIILLNTFGSCFAAQNQTQLIKHKGDCKLYLKYKGVYKQVHYAAYEKGGNEFPAYCLNPEADGVGSDGRTEYNVNITDKITNEKVWKVLINGYPYKSLEELGVENKDEAYSATQAAVYSALENRNVSDYEADSSSAGKRTLKAYLKIMEDAKNSKEVMNATLEIKPNSEIWEIDENETDAVSKTYTLSSNMSTGTVSVKLSGENLENIKITDINGNLKTNFSVNEKFKIIVPISLLTKDLEIKINANSNFVTNPIWYGKTSIEGTQNYALTGSTTENIEVSLIDLVPENKSKIIIIKQEEGTDKRLEGVKFNLLNSSNDVVNKDLITDENGEIMLEYLIPGTYYLQETETLANYNLREDTIEINLKLNEECKIIVDNTKKEIPKNEEPEKNEKETENIKEENIENEEESVKTEIVKKEIIKEETKILPVTGY